MSTPHQHRKSFLAATHLAGQSILLNVISVPVTAYLIHQLGAARFGEWSTATSLVAVATMMTNFGLRGTFVRSIAKHPETAQADIADQFGIRLALTILAAGVVMGACYFLHYPEIVIKCAAVASAGIAFTVIAATISDMLQGLHRMNVYAWTNFISGLVLTGSSAVVAAIWPSPPMVATAYLIGPLFSAGLLWYYVTDQHFSLRIAIRPEKWLPLLKNSRFIAVQQLITALSVNSEALILPPLLGTSVAGFGMYGVYAAGILLVNRLWVMPDSLASAFYPLIAQSMEKDPKSAQRDVGKYVLLSVAICLPVAVAVTFFSGAVAHILFAKHGDPILCGRVIRITIWALPLLGIELMMGYALNAAHKDAAYARAIFGAVCVSLAITLGLVIPFGIIGACYSFILRSVVRVAFISVPFMKTYSPPMPWLKFARVLACAGGMGAVMWLIHIGVPGIYDMKSAVSGLRGWSWMLGSLTVEGTMGMAAYGAGLIVLRILSSQEILKLLRRSPAA